MPQLPPGGGPPYLPLNGPQNPGEPFTSWVFPQGMPLRPAITHVNAGSISASGASAAAYSVTIPAGTGIQPGDLIVVNANSNGTHVTNGMSVQDSVNLTNYTTIKEQDLSSASTRWMQTFFYQTNVAIADGSTITLTPYASNVASSFCVDIFRGTSGAIVATVQGVSPAAGTTSLAPALLTAPPPFSLVLSFASFSASATRLSPPSPLPFTLGSNRLTTPSVGIAYVLAADGVSTYSVTWSNDSSQSNAAETVAFGALSTTGNLAVPPLHGPIATSSKPLPSRGVVQHRAGVFSQTGPQLYPLRGPVQARQPLPIRGRCMTVVGVPYDLVPPPPPALHGPVAAVSRLLPSRGRTGSNRGVAVAIAPALAPLYPLHGPVQAPQPLPQRGRTDTVVPIPLYYNGPPLTPLQRPVQAPQPLPVRGRAQGRARILTPILAPLYPLHGPVAAAGRSLGIRGRNRSSNGTRSQLGPHLTPLQQPVAARLRVLPPHGQAYKNVGTRGQTGSPLTPLHKPVQARYVLPPRGQAISRAGTFSAFTPNFGPPLYPLQGPVHARFTLPPRGRTSSNRGVFNQTGPQLTPLQRPAAARIQPPSPLKGRTQWRQGTSAQAGPALTPLHSPVKAAFRTLPPKGSAQGRAGVRNQTGPSVKPLTRPVFTFSPAPRRGTVTRAVSVRPFAQAVLYPRHGPVKAQPPLPPKGRTYRTPRYVPPATLGPPIYPLRHPVQARQPLPQRGQRWTAGPYVPPFVQPGGHGYPYHASLTITRWSAVLTSTEWAADMRYPVRYSAVLTSTRWPAGLEAGRWFAVNGPA